MMQELPCREEKTPCLPMDESCLRIVESTWHSMRTSPKLYVMKGHLKEAGIPAEVAISKGLVGCSGG